MIEANLDKILQKYESLLDHLDSIIIHSEKRVLLDEDELFTDNVNFFIKAYLVDMCTYVEALLQEIALVLSNDIHLRLRDANIPINFLHWQLPSSNYKDRDLKFEIANFSPLAQDINDRLSANPYKTLKLFELLGVELASCQYFKENKSLINSIVSKRNNIIHHNDAALDISFNDLNEYIKIFKEYVREIIKHIIK